MKHLPNNVYEEYVAVAEMTL